MKKYLPEILLVLAVIGLYYFDKLIIKLINDIFPTPFQYLLPIFILEGVVVFGLYLLASSGREE